MKTLVSILTLSICLSISTLATEIGFIDSEKIFQKAKFVQTYKEAFAEKEKDFNELLQKKSKKIEDAIAKGKKEEEIRELVQKRDEELEPKKQELMQYEMSFRQNFMLNISSTAKKVAEEMGLDIVMEKQVLYYGGFDLTNKVLDRLNK